MGNGFLSSGKNNEKGCLLQGQPFLMLFEKVYFETLSSQLTIANMAIIDRRQTTINTVQVTEIEILSYIIAPRNKEKLPMAVAVSHPPCINPCK
jgi:hypothetical protein